VAPQCLRNIERVVGAQRETGWTQNEGVMVHLPREPGPDDGRTGHLRHARAQGQVDAHDSARPRGGQLLGARGPTQHICHEERDIRALNSARQVPGPIDVRG